MVDPALDLAFSAFSCQKYKLSAPQFNIAETGTYGMSSITTTPELDGNIATLNLKHSSKTSITEDRGLAHLDVTHQTYSAIVVYYTCGS